MIDPALQEKFQDMKISPSYTKEPMINILEEIASGLGLHYDVIFGVVILGTPDRLWSSISSYSATIETQDLPKDLKAKLFKDVYLDFYQQTPGEILQEIAEKEGLKIDIRGDAGLNKGKKLSMRIDHVKLLDLLKLIAAPFSDDIKMEKETLVISSRGK